jgi:hypothetical protein
MDGNQCRGTCAGYRAYRFRQNAGGLSTPSTSFFVKVTPPEDTVEEKTTRILYISPIKALGSDIQRNLQIPLQGISEQRKNTARRKWHPRGDAHGGHLFSGAGNACAPSS